MPLDLYLARRALIDKMPDEPPVTGITSNPKTTHAQTWATRRYVDKLFLIAADAVGELLKRHLGSLERRQESTDQLLADLERRLSDLEQSPSKGSVVPSDGRRDVYGAVRTAVSWAEVSEITDLFFNDDEGRALDLTCWLRLRDGREALWTFRCGELNNSRCPFVVETEWR